MEKIKKSGPIKKYQWCMGFLGFTGFLGFFDPSQDSTLFLFFGFFGFFSWYWEYKLQQSGEDERLLQNRLKATNIAFRTAIFMVWFGAMLVNNLLPKIFVKMQILQNKYHFITIIIALGYAVGLILASYLTYRFDNKE